MDASRVNGVFAGAIHSLQKIPPGQLRPLSSDSHFALGGYRGEVGVKIPRLAPSVFVLELGQKASGIASLL